MDEPAGSDNLYKSDELAGSSISSEQSRAASSSADSAVEWTASEFVDRHKSASWYLVLAIITLVIAAAVYFAGRDFIAAGAVIAIGVIFGVIGARKPRTLEYGLGDRGLSVAGKLYPYSHFKAFSLEREGNFASFSLLPLRRFMPVMTIYYDPAAEDKIAGVLGDYLPLDNRALDPIDRFLKKIRF